MTNKEITPAQVLEMLADCREADDALTEANNNWPDSASEMRRLEQNFERAESAIRALDPATLRTQAQALAEREAGVIGEIATERQRQINKEGWTPEHDDEHTDGSLAAAAATYAAATTADGVQLHKVWPKSWDIRWYKPASKRRDLIKAAALIVAEIERLDRQALTTQEAQQ